jgi:REP element-mobilizing transposase RayT
MPDHFHGIIIIDRTLNKQKDKEELSKSLSEIIGKFKSFTTKKIRERLKDKDEFQWQKSFYDRIIRDEKELYYIRKYIQENPLRWDIEKNNPENLEI